MDFSLIEESASLGLLPNSPNTVPGLSSHWQAGRQGLSLPGDEQHGVAVWGQRFPLALVTFVYPVCALAVADQPAVHRRPQRLVPR